MGQTLASLPPAKRAKLYRQFAADAIGFAESGADNDQRANFLGMASSWHALALEAERALELQEMNTGIAAEIRTAHL